MEYKFYLKEMEKAENTIEKYTRDLYVFNNFMNGRELDKITVLKFKEYLIETYAATSVNSMLAAVNGFLDWIDYANCRVKRLRIQKSIFADPEKELNQNEYEKLIQTADRLGKEQLSLLIQTICSTGMRVSELEYITWEALTIRRADVYCKGKNRIVFLPKDLCIKLKAYCKKNQINGGIIFLTKGGKIIDRSNIWKQMKQLSEIADISSKKVFPHNLRHLFARVFYKIEKNIVRLADALGHSSILTTRIYLMETGKDFVRQLDKMKLVPKKNTT